MPIPPPNKIVRSLNSIRTQSGTSEGTIVPYKAYVVVTTLEMEKFRREAEQAKLLVRFEFIKSRLQFIETEKAAILRRLENSHRGPAIENPRPKLSITPVSSRVGFKMKY
jgi:hypothetical protein